MANKYKTQRTVLIDIKEDNFKKGRKYVFSMKNYDKDLKRKFERCWQKKVTGIIFEGNYEYLAMVNDCLLPVQWCKEVIEIQGGNK